MNNYILYNLTDINPSSWFQANLAKQTGRRPKKTGYSFHFYFDKPLYERIACYYSSTTTTTTTWWSTTPGMAGANTNAAMPQGPTQYLIHEEGGLERWFNLTITNVGVEAVADYTCVAVNAGGVMEEAITLTFEEPEPVRPSFDPVLHPLPAELYILPLWICTQTVFRKYRSSWLPIMKF